METTLISASSGFGGMLGLFGSAFVGIVIIAIWVLLASSRFVQGGVVERPERVPQLYGYTVCLVMLIWAIISTITLVNASLTLNDPLYRGDREFGPFEPSVSSFEAYRSTLETSRRYMSPEMRGTPADSVPEPVLRRRYEALRADRIARNSVEARRTLITSMLSLLIAAALFALHWRWLRRTVGLAPATTTRIDV